ATLGQLDIVLPGEKVPLSSAEKAEVAKAEKEIDARALAAVEQEKKDNLAKLEKLQEDSSRPTVGDSLKDPSIPGWFRQWYLNTNGGKNPSANTAKPYDDQELIAHRTAQYTGYYKAYSNALSDARILAFLDTRDPANADIAKAAQKLLENGQQVRLETEELRNLADGTKSAKSKVNAMASLMQNGTVLRDLLQEDPSSCHTAAGLTNFMANKDARNSTYIVMGLLTGGIGYGALAPAAIAALGIPVSAAALGTGAGILGGGAELAKDAKTYRAATRQTFSDVHEDAKVFGASRSIADVNDFEDLRDSLVVDAAITIATNAVPLAYKEFFAENSQALQSDAMVKRLMQDPKSGGLGLSETEAKKLLEDAASSDKATAKKAITKLAKSLNVSESELQSTEDMVKQEFANPDPAGAKGLTPKGFLERISDRFHSSPVKPDPDTYKRLRDAKIASYFPDTTQVQVQPGFKTTGANLTDAAVKKFQGDFDALLDQRGAGLSDYSGFRKWLIEKNGIPYPKLDAVTVESALKKQGATMDDIQSGLLLTYAAEMKSQGVNVLEYLHAGEIAHLGGLVAKKTGLFIFGALTTAVTVGPFTNVVNNILSAPMEPITESAGQLSNVLFANVTNSISKSLAKNMKKVTSSMAQLSSTTAQLDETKFDGLDRDDAKKLMDGFDTRYNEIFMRMGAYMPPYKRSGRDLINSWMINQPMQLASQASTFNTEYTMNQSFLVAMQEKTKDRAPTAEEKQMMQQYKDNMEESENRLAMALASWRMFTFIYAEAARDPMQADTNAKMFNTLQHYEKFMDMDKYRADLTDKVKEAFGQFDPSFKDLDKLEHRRQD
ncbi:MAG: hypothetical protein ACXWSD_12505, partial [Bdellovibrionota bacterium]